MQWSFKHCTTGVRVLKNIPKIISYARRDSQGKRFKGLCSIATFKRKL